MPSVQTYLIKRVVPVDISQPVTVNQPVAVDIDGEKVTLFRPVTTHEPATVDTLDDVETFEELPAPAVTLGGRLLALENETGFKHIALQGAVITRQDEAVGVAAVSKKR